MDVSDYDKAVVKYTIEEEKNEWHINLPNGNHEALPLGVDKEYEVDLSDVDTYGDFTVFSWNHTGKSITISEVYLYKEPSKLSLIKDHDYSTDDKYPWYRMEPAEGSGASFDVVDGALVISNPKVQTNNYDVQPFILDGITLKEGHNYLVRIKMKASANGSANIAMGTWGTSMSQTLNFSEGNDLVEYNLEFNNSTVESTGDIHILFQCGSYIGTVTISKVEVYEMVPSLKVCKEKLQAAIDKGNAQDSFAKTADSWTALTSLVSAGETALANPESEESLIAATDAIYSAIAGLELEAGYINLTAGMFKEYASVAEPGEGTSTGCSIELLKTSDLPYGDNSVNEKKWADLTEYNKLVVHTRGEIKPRFCMNRLVKDGQQAATQEDSKMLDINDNNGNTWSAVKYQTIEGNVYTIDLTKIVADYSFARLHSIKKQGWGTGVYVTDMLLYQSRPVTVTEAGYATFSSDKAVKLEGVTGYAAKYENDCVKLTAVTEVPAGEGVVIKADADDYELPVIASAAALDGNQLLVSDGTVKGDGSTIFALANKAKHGVGFYLVQTDLTVPAGQVYLSVPTTAREFIGFDFDATGIKEVETAKQNVEGYFNLAGQRVAQPTKGLYIVNGKKVVVK